MKSDPKARKRTPAILVSDEKREMEGGNEERHSGGSVAPQNAVAADDLGRGGWAVLTGQPSRPTKNLSASCLFAV